MRANDDARLWRASVGRGLPLNQPRFMGIVNFTPDSFSDGGAYGSVDEAVAVALRSIEEGALVVDVGGESTRPGSESVGASEQIRRTVPVIAALRSHDAASVCWISIDTTRAAVAHAALDAGADIINDVSAGADDDGMLPLAAKRRCGLILMHRLHQPRDDSFSTHYAGEPHYEGGVYRAVRDHLRRRVTAALEAGVHRDAIVIDPGLGFGKSVAQNYELAARMGELQHDLDLPVLSAASRKSFLTRTPGNADDRRLIPPRERLGASIAMTLSHWRQGVRLFRVHDVGPHAQAVTVVAALDKEQNPPVSG